MFERFTERARRALVIAQEEARTLEHSFIRPEHLLLGLARGEGLASTALNEAGVRYSVLRECFAEAVPPVANAGHLRKVPFSPQAKKTLELSLREALKLGHNYIGTEHLLLGVLQGAEDAEAKDNRVKDLIGDLSAQLRARVLDLVSGASALPRLRSPALVQATDRARQLAGQAAMTTVTSWLPCWLTLRARPAKPSLPLVLTQGPWRRRWTGYRWQAPATPSPALWSRSR
jgi:ATP-dependent Clp protease ATP-binding subunit ClpA